jgi:hypothetical protein
MAANMIFLSHIGDTVAICYFQMHYAILDVNLCPHAKYWPTEYVKIHTCVILPKSNIGPEGIHIVQFNTQLIYNKHEVQALHHAFDLCSESQESVMI